MVSEEDTHQAFEGAFGFFPLFLFGVIHDLGLRI